MPLTRLSPHLQQHAVTAAAYAALAWAAMSLAIPPGYASPLYPSAGVALASALAWGRWHALSAALASLALNTWLGLRGPVPGPATLPLMIACGVGVQTWLGATLVRRHLRGVLTLDEPSAVVRFMLLAGPLASVMSATIGTLALLGHGVIQPHEIAVNWVTWWGGDALGVLIATPVMLALIGQPRDIWAPRRVTVALPLVATTGMLWMAISAVSQWENERAEATFSRDANALANSVVLGLQAHLNALDAIHGVYLASRDVTREEFRAASIPWRRKLPGLQAIGWHERVPLAEVPKLEAAVREEGLTGFHVFNRPESASIAADDDEVVAMRFVEPMGSNARALGVNVLSLPAARAAIDASRRRDAAVASSAFRLTQETGDQVGVVVYRAVYDGSPEGEAERLHATRGLVFVTLRMGDALAHLAPPGTSGLSLCLIDKATGQFLAGPPGCAEPAPRRTRMRMHTVTMPFAERAWEVRVVSAPITGMDDGWNAWLFSAVGLLAAALLGTLLLVMTGRTLRIEAAVRDRTRQLEHEVSERRLAEEALRDSERRFRNIFNTVPIGVVYTDLDGRIMQANPGFSMLTGYGGDELLRMSTHDLTHPDDRGGDLGLMARLAQGELPMYRRDKRYLTKDGQTRWVRVLVRPLRDANGAPYRTVGVVEDITEHLRLQEAERGREAAEAANRAKSEFLSRMSHELRTPLNAMLGFAQLLALGPQGAGADARRSEWVDQIQKAGWHLLEMINDVLDLSRIELGAVRLDRAPVDVDAVLHESASLVQAEAAGRGVGIRLGPVETGLSLLGDATRVKQILTNLLSNAVKYNRDGGQVDVTVRRTGEGPASRIEIEVIDQGLGMSPAQMEGLFQPFNRLGRERSGVSGTGIGLVISRRLAESMGGTLTARSVEHCGSTFTLSLPATGEDDPGSPHPGTQDRHPAAAYGRRRVHYVEDNEVNVEVMRGVLSHRPQVALSVSTTSREGLAAVRSQPPDLLLLDLHLPDGHGLDLLRQLQADPRTRHIPVVVVTADALEEQVAAAASAGARHYLTKPLDLQQVLEVLDQELGGSQPAADAQAVTGTATTPRPG